MNERAVSVSVAGAAERIGVSRPTVYALIAAGKLRSFTLGRRRLIAVVELERFAERQTALQNVQPVPPQRRVSVR